MTDVHTGHCCAIHGCKYGDEDCTVGTLRAPQSYPCEACDMVMDGAAERIAEIRKVEALVKAIDAAKVAP